VRIQRELDAKQQMITELQEAVAEKHTAVGGGNARVTFIRVLFYAASSVVRPLF
jgi:hypothetical protein